MTAHEIDYRYLEEMQYVEIELDPQNCHLMADGWTRSKWKRFSEMVQSKSGIFGF
jgi:hypothetical protein